MTLAAFKTLANAATLTVQVSSALPYGGWEKPGLLSRLEGLCDDSAELDQALETCVVIATDAHGAICGAWSPVAHRFVQYFNSIDDAYVAVSR